MQEYEEEEDDFDFLFLDLIIPFNTTKQLKPCYHLIHQLKLKKINACEQR